MLQKLDQNYDLTNKHLVISLVVLYRDRPIFEVNMGGTILSGISYHCNIRTRISADNQNVKYVGL